MEVGTEKSVTILIEDHLLAANVGSGDVKVFSTPMMIALMEHATCQCVKGSLAEGETTVGTQIDVTHLSATPAGLEVTATAKIAKIDGRKITFEVTCADKGGIVGSGTIGRIVVDRERFETRARGKLDG